MKCENCGNKILIQIATKINSKNCKVLTNLTSIITIQCENCKRIFQVPIQNKSFFSVGKDFQDK